MCCLHFTDRFGYSVGYKCDSNKNKDLKDRNLGKEQWESKL